MNSFNHLEDGYLPGWPARIDYMSTSAGAQILQFAPGEDEVLKISDNYSITLEAQNRINHLTGKNERGGYYGDLSQYYPDFVYDVLGNAQKRVIDCLTCKNRNMRKTTQESLAEIAEKFAREQGI